MTDQRVLLRKEVSIENQWDLTPLFSSDNEWETALEQLKAVPDQYGPLKGTLGDSPERLLAALDFDMETHRSLDRLYAYAHLKNDQDKSDAVYDAMYQKAMSLYARIREAASFMEPEIQQINAEALEAWMEMPAFADYRFHLETIIRIKPYTREPEVESLIAMGTEMAQTARAVFDQLNNADMTFGTVEAEGGAQRELTHGNFITFLVSSDRNVRQQAFNAYYKTFDDHRHTLAASLAGSIKTDWYHARVRRYSSCRQAALFPNAVAETVYDNLIRTVRDNLTPLGTYLDLRKQILGVEALHMYDTYVPLVPDMKIDVSFEEAVETVIHALSPLGSGYTETLKQGLTGGWVDRYENKGKRSGAYSSGCYDSPPYILMNYEPSTLGSMFTLAHEAGHSMHTDYSNQNQPYVNHQYSIFVAEVASTFNEVLLTDHLLRMNAGNARMEAYLINREIDDIRATLIRQTMFAEFEHRLHRDVESGMPVTLERIRGCYGELLDIYFASRLTVDPALTLEGLRIPHFYSAFYVYQYATGISAAIALAKQVLSGSEGAVERYLKFLSLGGSCHPLDALRIAGVDMEQPEPVTSAMTYLGQRIEGLCSRLTDGSV